MGSHRGRPVGRDDTVVTHHVPASDITIHYPVTLNRVMGLLFAILWGGFLTVVMCTKMIMQLGGTGYVRYMTNWSWTVQATYFDLYALFTIVSIVREYVARKTHSAPVSDFGLRVLYEIMYLTVQMAVTGVFFGLVVVLYYAPELLSENFDTVGEGLTYGGNAVVHYVPPFMFALHTLSIIDDLRHIFAKSIFGLLWCIVRAVLLGFVFVAVYCAAFSPGNVYNLPDVGVTLATCTVFFASSVTVAAHTVIALSPMGSAPLAHPTRVGGWINAKVT